jgi:hypothetical protein
MGEMILCARCGGTFEPRRLTARFCSTACRMAAHRALSVTPAIVTQKVSVTRSGACLGAVLRRLDAVPSADLTRRAVCPDDRLILDNIAAVPGADDCDALRTARGFYRGGMAAGLAGKTGPFPLMTAADVFFYRGWRCARRARTTERMAA